MAEAALSGRNRVFVEAEIAAFEKINVDVSAA
jgi:hypothetical protein